MRGVPPCAGSNPASSVPLCHNCLHTCLPFVRCAPLSPARPHHRDVHTFSGLSQAFFGLATMPLAFERVCSQQPAISGKLVAAALPLIGCGFDLARKTVRGGGVRRVQRGRGGGGRGPL